MEENQEIIGIRGEAKQGKTASIILMVCGAFTIAFGLLIGLFLLKESETDKSILPVAIFMLAFFIGFGAFFITFAAINYVFALSNDKVMDKPVLIYDKETDEFIGYNCRKGNQKVVIKNGSITKIKGSAFWTARELFITYSNNGSSKRVSLGFCRNIDNNAFRRKLNEYHNPKL